jgi:hypothetical protein
LAARAVILSLIGTLTYILNWEFASYYWFFIYIYMGHESDWLIQAMKQVILGHQKFFMK